MVPTAADVVVVGAGPTGLALACTLRRAGIDVVVVDRATEGTNTSRAAVVHAGTLETLEDLEVTPRILTAGRRVPVFTVRDRHRVLARLDFSTLPTRHPYTVMIPQSRTEEILTGRLRELGTEVARPWALTSIAEGPEQVHLVATDRQGQNASLTARYVIGADGMNSAVREAAGIASTGARYPQSFVLADVRLQWPLPDDEVQLFFSSAGLVVVAPLPDGHHRVVATLDDAPEHVTAPLVQTVLDERGPGGATVRDVVWESRFQVHHRLADQYRSGHVFLAGDAAHVHSPAGGQGMNTGIQDAVCLGDLLARVVSGGAPEDVLDQYEARRRPIAEGVVRLTDRATRMATLHHPVPRAARNTALAIAGRVPALRRRLLMQLSELSASRA